MPGCCDEDPVRTDDFGVREVREKMMNWKKRSFVLAAVLGVSAGPVVVAQQPSPNLDVIVKDLDQASARFQSAEADFRWDLFERVVRQTTTQNGAIYFVRDKGTNTVQMGARIEPPQAKVLEYRKGTLRVFDPGSDHLTELSAGANRAQYESFLTLGFGGSGKDLAAAWTITDGGSESMNDGAGTVKVEKLELVPKDPNVRNTFTRVTIWVDLERGISLKQEFVTPSDDTRTAVYTHIRYNGKVDPGKYAIKTDKKTTYDRR